MLLNLNSAVITGSQDRLSISGGSMSVSSSGVTKSVESGQISFISDGNAPTNARKLQKGDLDGISNGLKMTNDTMLMNLKFVPVKPHLAV